MAVVPVPEKWDYEADIIVVGAGTAGLPAAIVAAEAGDKVAVLELMSSCAGSLALINVGPAFAGTDMQKEVGIEDSPEEYYKDGVELAKGDPEIWRAFTDNELDTYYWCQSIGMNLGKDILPGGGHRKARSVWKKGSEMIASLEKTARAKGVDTKFLHRATRLITDPKTGRVLGLKVTVKNKTQDFKARKAVILATGGFGRNKEMVEEFGPDFVDWLPTMGPGHLGDGLKMSLAIGAATKHISRAVCGSFAVDVNSKSGIMDAVGTAGGIFVNVNGERFADESLRLYFYGIVTERGMNQPGKVWFAIYDDNMNKNTLRHAMIKKAKPVQADTIEELAEKLGIDTVGLKKTIDKYHSDIDQVGYDTVFDRRTQQGYEGKPLKIDTPPFYGFKCTGATSSFKGGIKINGSAQVLNQYGEIIPSLYAAGEVTGGLWGSGGTYLPGTMVTASMTFGRIAARKAVKEPLW